MGLKAGLQILQQTGKAVSKYTDDVVGLGVRKWTKPTSLEGLRFAPEVIGDTTKLSKVAQKIKLKNFTHDEILDMKPSTFKKILGERTDIPEYINKDLLTPEKLNLYDELMELEAIQKMPKDKLDKALTNLFGEYNLKYSEASAQLEIIPDLVKKGVHLESLVSLPITHSNKNQIEYLLKRFDFSEWDSYDVENLFKIITDDNAKYLDELLNLRESPFCLPFWSDDTAKIIREFRDNDKIKTLLSNDRLSLRLSRQLCIIILILRRWGRSLPLFFSAVSSAASSCSAIPVRFCERAS